MGEALSDVPVCFRWQADSGALSFLGRAASDATVRAIVTQAYVVGLNDHDQWISYSRRKCWYSEKQRYHGPHTYTTITRGVDLAAHEGWIEHRKVKPGSKNNCQSTFRATEKLIHEMHGVKVTLAPSYEPIVLRGDRGVQPYQDIPATWKMRRNLTLINDAISSAQIAHPALGIIRPGDPTRFEYADRKTGEIRQTQSGPADMSLFRVFHGNFNLHGRFYGPFWQQWPAQERAQLTIDGGRVCEEDYASIHPRLLYQERGMDLPGDPYDIPGIRRDVAKIALLVMINAKNRREALISLRRRDWELCPPPSACEVEATVEALEKKHRPIADAFYSDSGIRLMWHDARMAETVMLDLRNQNITTLPVHDSFIVRAEFRQNLLTAMEEALKTATQVSTRQQKATTKALRERKEDRQRTPDGHMWNRKQYVEPKRAKPLNRNDKTEVAKVFATKAA